MSTAHDEVRALVHAARRALETGRPAQAQAALEDARRLGPDHPEVRALADRLAADSPEAEADDDAWGETVNWDAGPILPPPGGAAPEPDPEAVAWFGSGPSDGGDAADPAGPEETTAPALALLLAEADPPSGGATGSRDRGSHATGAASGGTSDSTSSEAATLVAEARALFDRGDFTGSLTRVERALELEPGHPEASEYLGLNESTLIQMYESKLGPLERVPCLAVDPDEVAWLNLDHRAGFVLAQIDGEVTWEDLFALSGMSRLDTCRILVELLDEGVVQAA